MLPIDRPEQIENRIMTRAMQYPDLANLYLQVLDAAADSAGEIVDGDDRGWMERDRAQEHHPLISEWPSASGLDGE